MAKLTLEKYFRDDNGNDKPWLFPQLLAIAKRWIAESVTLKDNTFPQLLLLIQLAHDAALESSKTRLLRTLDGDQIKPVPSVGRVSDADREKIYQIQKGLDALCERMPQLKGCPGNP